MAQNLKIKRFWFEFTRPANTTAYTAQDAVSDSATAPTIITWKERTDPNVTYDDKGLTVGGSYMIKSLKLTKNAASTTNASFDLYLYSSGVTNTNDNVEMGITYANKVYRIGKASFTLATAGTTNSNCAEQTLTDVNHTFRAVSTNFFSVLVATAAYTPASGELFYGEAELIRIDQ